MRIIHHFGLRIDDELARARFREIGFELPKGVAIPGGGAITSIEIAEDEPTWEKVSFLAHEYKGSHFVSTKFSDAELDAARHLGMVADSHHEYPEPSDDYEGYLAATFDLSGYCLKCGIGLKQKAPFRIKRRPPTLKPTSVLQLNWVFDEYFVTPELWKSVFKPFGVPSRPVLGKNGAELTGVVQLDIQELVGLKLREFECEECRECGRKKNRLKLRGPLPKLDHPHGCIAKTKEYFGSGANAFRLVLLSQALYAKLAAARARNVSFYPCAE